jgi:subfamily B ATP-binding cassette protein HlyB/CyaB
VVIGVRGIAGRGAHLSVFAHTTSRIDVELGARLFRHLLALPLAYFQARRVGESVARVRELENIRNFLTGHAMTLGAGSVVLGGVHCRDAGLQLLADA